MSCFASKWYNKNLVSFSVISVFFIRKIKYVGRHNIGEIIKDRITPSPTCVNARCANDPCGCLKYNCLKISKKKFMKNEKKNKEK